MDCKEKNISFLKDVRNMKEEALLELNNMFMGYAINEYFQSIGKFHGNKYLDDYLVLIQEKVLNAAKTFPGTNRRVFCSYINKCIKNTCKTFCRDYIKSKYICVSLNEALGISGACNYLWDNGDVANYVVNRTIKNQIYEEIFSVLTKSEKKAIIRRIKDIESIEEYADKNNCTANTVRSHESRALKKMIKYVRDKKLNEMNLFSL
ncbi:sigma-70 family RNA polymerase sigma factor [Clostridium sp. A1-XYC3]|uniref:Sigma-70 family RNA polymerase sigma factor n=1 Tax=Clostridium tanneri TaxID=3037988 RepID=A0ABU4JVG7_9CLOT|nr:sigma-70 family RNA polymerase sigma factor [Clostridium sp. A1-XYC3]MDW8802142.1 sigma-70 family RNA polymerase sigma factor [Clostridium sp. A1-XYC3]